MISSEVQIERIVLKQVLVKGNTPRVERNAGAEVTAIVTVMSRC